MIGSLALVITYSSVLPLNALSPIDVRVEGSSTFFNLEQPLKAFLLIVLTPSGMVISVSSTLFINADLAIAITVFSKEGCSITAVVFSGSLLSNTASLSEAV